MFVNPNAYGGIDFMDISILEVLGPVMIGPSSSHTAGAARLGRVSAVIAGKSFSKVEFGLHGSFAHTYKGPWNRYGSFRRSAGAPGGR